MEHVGILVVSYGSRAAAMVDAFSQSTYAPDLYIADKQNNPFNRQRAKEHQVIADLSVENILSFAKKHADRISFGIVDSEAPIIKGVRDIVEKETGIPMVCPTKEFALEESKVNQRRIMEKCCPEANPRFKVFRAQDFSGEEEMKKELKAWLAELDSQAVVKPDLPGYGKGVGVWGDHFNSFEELYAHFMSIYGKDAVIVEEKIDGEESSLQCFTDGNRLIPLPDVRDYKRAFEDDAGPNTGGMGSYKDSEDFLPFMTAQDREWEIETAQKMFRFLRKEGEEPGLRGVALYFAYMHGKEGSKILEINSRGGDPEFINVLALLKNDFVDVCFDMIDGCLKNVRLEKKASVLTYKVPASYGGFAQKFPGKVDREDLDSPVDLAAAYKLSKQYAGNLRIYPGSLKLAADGKNYALSSRTVACLGIGEDIETARDISLEGVSAIKGGGLWYRSDVASKSHIAKSVGHMKDLRR